MNYLQHVWPRHSWWIMFMPQAARQQPPFPLQLTTTFSQFGLQGLTHFVLTTDRKAAIGQLPEEAFHGMVAGPVCAHVTAFGSYVWNTCTISTKVVKWAFLIISSGLFRGATLSFLWNFSAEHHGLLFFHLSTTAKHSQQHFLTKRIFLWQGFTLHWLSVLNGLQQPSWTSTDSAVQTKLFRSYYNQWFNILEACLFTLIPAA